MDFAYELMNDIHPLMHHPIYKPFPALEPFKGFFNKKYPLWMNEDELREFESRQLAEHPQNEPLMANQHDDSKSKQVLKKQQKRK